jgi:N-acetyl-gamma-glutamyl-phosphate reductase
MMNGGGTSMGRRVRVGIAGATGYAGQEVVRLVARHPQADLVVTMASSASSPARPLPALAHVFGGVVAPLDVDRLGRDVDAVFLALPEEASATLAPGLLERGVRVIDLSGAFRLTDEARRARWYPHSPGLPASWAYGLTERYREQIAAAQFIANPGCYPTAAGLALGPLGRAGLLTGDITIDAKSGVSGAGKTPTERTHFSECHGSVSAYGVFGHRHAAEIEQEAGAAVTFVPHLVPLDRGILETIYLRVVPGTTAATVASVYEAAYGESTFVRLTGSALPTIKQVAYTNFCDIGWVLDAASDRMVVVSVIDNLLKGAAGQAVQNLNVAFGLDERTGIL